MKKIQFLILTFFLFFIQFSQAQSLHNKTGYYVDYGANNNTGIGYWFGYSNNGAGSNSFDTVFSCSQSTDALIFQGVNDNPGNPTYNHVGFMQNRNWGGNWPGYTIDMSNPENMSLKIRMKSTGSLTPRKIYLKLTDTLGNRTLDGASYFIIEPTGAYEEYYFNFANSWRDMTQGGPLVVVDSSAISGFDFYVELESPLTDLSVLRFEIDYVQIGSYVDWEHNTLTGRVYNDNNADCIFNSTDTPVKQGLIKALPGPYYAYTDENGYYELKVDTLTTSYTISYSPTDVAAKLLQSICPVSGAYTIATPTAKMNYCCNDFAQKIKQCAVLNIDITSNRRRRCFRNVTYVTYRNDGNINSIPASIKVVYPEFVKPISSIPAWTRKNGDTLYYSVGSLAAYSINTITITDSVVCGNEDIRSLTQCTKATISPGNVCMNNISTDWDNADVVVVGKCDIGVAKFKILNEGIGDMDDSTLYRVYANDTLIFHRKFLLKSREFFHIQLPTSGKVIRLEADQVIHHPDYNTIPRMTLEGCVSNPVQLRTAYKGLAMNTPKNEDLVTAISCLQITDSYDPNDKAVSPKGISDKNYISAGTKLKYKIRFENTGTDDAYTVVVVDTLDADLDVSTFLAGNSSHPYTIKRENIDGKEIVKFHFNQINLTPKKVDSIKSQGFIEFSIYTKPTLSDGALITNEASIFFDYNSAIITNTTSQTIGEYVEEDLSKGSMILRTEVINITTGTSSQIKIMPITVYPNPTNDKVTVKFNITSANASIRIYSIDGKLVLSQSLDSNGNEISLQEFPQGIYYYKITDSNGLDENGKIVRQ